MNLTAEDIQQFRNATNCHICSKTLGVDRVRDHCHITGKFRGAAHSSCNLNYKVPKFLPIFFHNLTGYDAHLFVKELGNIDGDIRIIPLNKEKYISISKLIEVDNVNTNQKELIELRFLDSFRFLPSSIDNISKTLAENDFKILSKFCNGDKNSFELMTRKGVFCYDYIDSVQRLSETELPPISQFKNSLLETECSQDDYEHAMNVWNNFQCSTLSHYLEHYLITDVLILADIFEKFRIDSRTTYGLDPCHYFTLPGFSWSAMLKHTNIKLELLTDINMYNFFSKGIRGGLTQCTLRYCQANNKYMQEYDASKPSEYLMYLDANNLYGWAMSDYLPHSGFEWIDAPTNLSLVKEWLLSDTNVGYVLEVDLEYPQHIHDHHNDLPFCPSNISINNKPKKLIADLRNKKNYTIHYKTLLQCIENGLVLSKIHRVIKFNQSPWLKKYIDLNNSLRIKATNKFEKDLRKLCNNAVFGKTMENVDKRKDVLIVCSTENSSNGRRLGARALIAKPNFHSILEFGENMAAVQMNRTSTFYNKPIYLGFSVLEISKYKMYDFHYTYMKPKFSEKNLRLAYMDTDSFVYQINTDDFYEDIKDDIKEKFDTSDYPFDNPYGITQLNMKKLGFMKDENCGKIMTEFIGLRAKMYSINVQNSNVIKKAKGVKATAVKKLRLSDYRDCLLQKKDFYCIMQNFRSKQHVIYTQTINKKSLSCEDDKRYICENNINTLAWGHYDINS